MTLEIFSKTACLVPARARRAPCSVGIVVTTSRGFSLIEVLIATAILVTGMAALAQLFVLAISANARSRATTVAVMLAEQKVEQLAASSVDLMPSPPDALTRNETGFWDSTGGF